MTLLSRQEEEFIDSLMSEDPIFDFDPLYSSTDALTEDLVNRPTLESAIELPGFVTTLAEFGNSVTRGVTFGLSDAFGLTAEDPVKHFYDPKEYGWRIFGKMYVLKPSEPSWHRSIIRFGGEAAGTILPIVATGGVAAAGLSRLGGKMGWRALQHGARGATKTGIASRWQDQLIFNTAHMGSIGVVSSSFRAIGERKPLPEALASIGTETAFWAAIPGIGRLGEAGIRRFEPTARAADWVRGKTADIGNWWGSRFGKAEPVDVRLTPDDLDVNPTDMSLLAKVLPMTKAERGVPLGSISKKRISTIDFTDDEFQRARSLLEQLYENTADATEKRIIMGARKKLADSHHLVEMNPDQHILQIENVLYDAHEQGLLNLAGDSGIIIPDVVKNIALNVRSEMSIAAENNRRLVDGVKIALKRQGDAIMGARTKKPVTTINLLARQMAQYAPYNQANMTGRIYTEINKAVKGTPAARTPAPKHADVKEAQETYKLAHEHYLKAAAIHDDVAKKTSMLENELKEIERLKAEIPAMYTAKEGRRFFYQENVSARGGSYSVDEELRSPAVWFSRNRGYRVLAGEAGRTRDQKTRKYTAWLKFQWISSKKLDELEAKFLRMGYTTKVARGAKAENIDMALTKTYEDLGTQVRVVHSQNVGLVIDVRSAPGVRRATWDKNRDETFHRVMDEFAGKKNAFADWANFLIDEGKATGYTPKGIAAEIHQAQMQMEKSRAMFHDAADKRNVALRKADKLDDIEVVGHLRDRELMDLSVSARDMIAESTSEGWAKTELAKELEILFNSDYRVQAAGVAKNLAAKIATREVVRGNSKLLFSPRQVEALHRAIQQFTSIRKVDPEMYQYFENTLFHAISDEDTVIAMSKAGHIIPTEFANTPLITDVAVPVGAKEQWFVNVMNRMKGHFPDDFSKALGRELHKQHAAGRLTDMDMQALQWLQAGAKYPIQEMSLHTGMSLSQLERKVLSIPELADIIGTMENLPAESIDRLLIRTGIRAADDPVLLKDQGAIRLAIDRKWATENLRGGPLTPMRATEQAAAVPVGSYGIEGKVPMSRVRRIEVDPTYYDSDEAAKAVADRISATLKENGQEHIKVFV
ncbi:MAG: hypothetical protein ACXABY_09215, partial [Candidatus Thorarchaeota archaeon]